MTHRIWADLKTNEFSDLPGDAVALLSVGAIEQHGPHLPVSTDATLAEALAKGAAELGARSTVLLLPTLAFGKSDEHLTFKGTITLDAETLLAVLLHIGRSVTRAGDAAAASAEAGKAIVSHATARFATLLEEVARYEVASLGAPT